MNRLSSLLRKQGQLLLKNDTYALVNTVMLIVLPYTGWLAASVLALVTLRKGMRAGGMLLVPALVANLLMLKSSLPITSALIFSLITFFPVYILALVLRATRSWQVVGLVLMFLVFSGMCVLHAWMPEWILQQYVFLRQLLHELQLDSSFPILLQKESSESQLVLANYFTGIQAACLAASVLFSLAFARYIQSLIYYPGGFKQEMHALCGKKVDFLVFVVTVFAARHAYMLAINLLPLYLLFFLIVALSLWFNCMAMPGMFRPVLVLSVCLCCFPHVALPVLILVGVLDSLVNFRSILLNRADKPLREVK